VVLLLHQQEKLLESPQRRPVFLLKISERLQQPHHRDPALVADMFAHARSDTGGQPVIQTPCPKVSRQPGWSSPSCALKGLISATCPIWSTAFSKLRALRHCASGFTPRQRHAFTTATRISHAHAARAHHFYRAGIL